MESITGQHWLYEWIDEYEVNSPDMVRTVLKSSGAVDKLIHLAGHQSEMPPSVAREIPSDGAVVAGLGLDLMSKNTCQDFDCRAEVADYEFSQVLHYFDAVVMEASSRPRYAYLDEITTKRGIERAIYDLVNDVSLMLHLRETGLVNYIIFKQGVDCFCEDCMHQYARRIGVDDLVDDDELLRLAKEMSKTGRVGLEEREPGVWYGWLNDPDFVGNIKVPFIRKAEPKKFEVAFQILRDRLDETIFDAATARRAGIPLASLGAPGLFLRPRKAPGLTVEDVALRVRIPVLVGLRTQDLIRLRESEYEHFRRFQELTAEAIDETINKAAVSSPERAAEFVWQRRIRPQIVELENKMAASRRAMTRKIMLGTSFGAATAAIGSTVSAVAASGGMPLVAAIGAAAGTLGAAPTVLPFLVKRIEEQQQFEADRTYFLWKAIKASH
ncbi:hypothetical protein [Micromonospora maris]|uniref:hypothetical protein n=1 Tax=Micromonospora maris TaxID=1003110 RepID=UPI002E144808|nr:hypothetical protein OG712_20310 [Micromonospora maris]